MVPSPSKQVAWQLEFLACTLGAFAPSTLINYWKQGLDPRAVSRLIEEAVTTQYHSDSFLNSSQVHQDS